MLRAYRVYQGEVVGAAAGIVWGLNLLNPFTDAFDSIRAMLVKPTNFVAIDENIWGAAAFVVGLAHLYGLTHRQHVRTAACMAIVVWGAASLTVATSGWTSPGVTLYGMFIFNALYTALSIDPRVPSIMEVYRVHREGA